VSATSFPNRRENTGKNGLLRAFSRDHRRQLTVFPMELAANSVSDRTEN
jgi:hypothetical protein